VFEGEKKLEKNREGELRSTACVTANVAKPKKPRISRTKIMDQSGGVGFPRQKNLEKLRDH